MGQQARSIKKNGALFLHFKTYSTLCRMSVLQKVVDDVSPVTWGHRNCLSLIATQLL